MGCYRSYSICGYIFSKSLADIHKEGTVLSIDGKGIAAQIKLYTLRGVKQIVLGQKKADKKSNEITAIPELLELLDIRSRIITIDAMGAQREICEQIIDQKGEYLISLKGNQGRLHKDVIEYFKSVDYQ